MPQHKREHFVGFHLRKGQNQAKVAPAIRGRGDGRCGSKALDYSRTARSRGGLAARQPRRGVGVGCCWAAGRILAFALSRAGDPRGLSRGLT